MPTEASVNISISRQPGANIIKTVDNIKAVLPELRASIPRATLDITSDRNEKIRASVHDIEFTLMPDRRAGDHGHFLFFAQRLGDRDPEHFGAIVHRRHIWSNVLLIMYR